MESVSERGHSGTGAGGVQARCFPDRAQLLAALEERLKRALTDSGTGGAVAVMLSGGNTPIPAYRALAQQAVRPAPGLSVLFSDDRYVPSDSDASNYHQTRPLLDTLDLPADRVLRVRTELPLEESAADYERRLGELASAGTHFGLGLLGLGADGHTASLFRAEDIERARGRRAIPVHRPDGRDAVSVTPEVLAWMDEILFVVAGADKRAALASLLEHNPALTAWKAVSGSKAVAVWTEPEAWPAGRTAPAGRRGPPRGS
jgi:6-phosphogluconolactonase